MKKIEAFRMNWRAVKLLNEKCPNILSYMMIQRMVTALAPYVNIYFSAQIINELAGARSAERLWKLVILTVTANTLLALLGAVMEKLEQHKYSTYWYKTERIFSEKFLTMDFAAVDEQHTYDLRSQIKQNVDWLGGGFNYVINYCEKLIGGLVRIIGSVVLTVSLFTWRVPNGRLTLLNHPVFAIGIVVVLFGVTMLVPLCSTKAESYLMKNEDTIKLGNRCFNFYGFNILTKERMPDIRMYNQQVISEYYMEMDKSFTPDSPFAKAARGPMGFFSALASGISVIFTGLVYVFVCLKAWGGAFGIGSVTQYIGAITSLSKGVAEIFEVLGSMQNNAEMLKPVFEFLDIPNDMYQGSLTTEKRSDRKYEIEFKNVSFKYPGSEMYALKNLSMKFRVGQRLAVVGMNGSGKTTFIKLLCRLYDPDEGEILLNGINIRKYNYADYMQLFSVVFQDFQLTAFTLGENVAVNVDYDCSRAEECLKKAGFGNRLAEMPKGLDTYLYREFDEEGINISGGEAQKIALARVLYKDAPFIILDEPTAALDPIAEAEVYTKFNEIVEDKTAVYISHRLSSCRFCDEIVVFDQGQVVQQGSHEELVNIDGGKYQELWNAQAQYYTEQNIRMM